MDIRPAFLLQTVIKAMTDVVLPAVDPNNKLAQEQALLVIDILNLVTQRLPLTYRYDSDELARLLAFANELRRRANELPGSKAALQALSKSVDVGADVLGRARAEPREIEATNFDLRQKIGALITAIYSGTEFAKLKGVSSVVTAHAKEQLLRERSWLIAQGWETDPKSIPGIEALLGEERPPQRF
jgi:hypothetical protein